MEFDELSQNVIGCAIEVHRNLGPGLLESTYRQCLASEFSHARIPFQMELPWWLRLSLQKSSCELQSGFTFAA